MSATSDAAVAELRDAATFLSSGPNPPVLSQKLSLLLRAHADYWALWFPDTPTRIDRAVLELARTVIALYPNTPDTDAGIRQNDNTQRKNNAV